ncbi:hypothetical protein [Undibacterium seohonense]|nr:hypothetical protein [Undibacterium seohonense]
MFKRNWMCETYNSISANDMRFHPVTHQEPRNLQPYSVKTLSNGMVLIYHDIEWCEKKDYAPETLNVTLLDRFGDPTYGQQLSLKQDSSERFIDKRNPRFRVKLISINAYLIKQKIKTDPIEQQEKKSLQELKLTAGRYQKVTIAAWRHDPTSKKTIDFQEQLLKFRNGIWDAEDIEFPSIFDDYRVTTNQSFAFIPLSREQRDEKIKNKEQVIVKFNGELIPLGRSQQKHVRSNKENFDSMSLEYGFDIHSWSFP